MGNSDRMRYQRKSGQLCVIWTEAQSTCIFQVREDNSTMSRICSGGVIAHLREAVCSDYADLVVCSTDAFQTP